MADRRASLEGHLGRSRHRSPASDTSPDYLESLYSSPSVQAFTSVARRRPLRAQSVPTDTPQSTSPCVDTDKPEPRKAKGGRATPRKTSRGNSPQGVASSPKPSSIELVPEREKDAIGFLPKLSRILEGRESKASRRRRSSTASSADDHIPSHCCVRPTENVSVVRRPTRQKHGSLQRRADSLANLPNPSLLSVLSGLTQHSSASSGSNSTITQKSYDKTHISKRKPAKERKRLQPKSSAAKLKAMSTHHSSVFQYMNDGLMEEQFVNGDPNGSRPSSSSSGSSRDTDRDDLSSNAEELPGESPMTSPASLRRSDYGELRERNRYHSDSNMSVGEGSPTPDQVSPLVNHVDVEEDENEGDSEEEDGENAAYSADDHEEHHDHALERVPPPRLPSASSRHSDPHTRHLRHQEQELRNHILQSPQPHRDFQFAGGPSPNPHPAMPLYEAYAHSGVSPVDFYAPAPNAHGWPPPAPPPPPIGYYSPPHVPQAPYSPTSDHSFTMASRPPMAVPNMAVPPLQHAPVQPPYYQPSAAPNLAQTTIVGYELLADKLSEVSKGESIPAGESNVVPMYRKFGHLNHRVLLHLQDEIAELEEELRYLDECVAQSSPKGDTGHINPASRRSEARYGSELHWRRTELLGRIYLKLGQYNQALASFSNLTKNLDPARTEQIQAYRSWMEKRAPIDPAEARFLERKNDLLAISRGRSASTVGGVGNHQSAAIWLPLVLVLPLMAFAIVPGLLGRLLIIVLIGAAEAKVVVASNELMELMTIREWATCASIYFGFMALLAAMVH